MDYIVADNSCYDPETRSGLETLHTFKTEEEANNCARQLTQWTDECYSDQEYSINRLMWEWQGTLTNQESIVVYREDDLEHMLNWMDYKWKQHNTKKETNNGKSNVF